MGNGFQRTEHEFSGQTEKSFLMKDLWIEIVKRDFCFQFRYLTGSVRLLLNPFQKYEPLSICALIKAYVFSAS